jgi:uncharacterized protein
MADPTAGTPIWVDLGTPDVDAAIEFYAQLFAWTAQEAGDPEETGGYWMFRSNDRLVAGVGPLQSEGQPPVWTTYVATDDADETAGKVTAAGGTVLVQPFDVMDAGRMAVLMDPTGAVFGVWQPRQHTGAEVFNEPVSLTWNELATRDTDAAERFYAEVFGWTTRTPEMGVLQYTWFFNGVRGIAGMRHMGEESPAGVPSHWLTYFTVADTDETVSRVESLGGSVHVPATDVPPGRFAVLADPAGAAFGVMRPTDDQERAAKAPEGVQV